MQKIKATNTILCLFPILLLFLVSCGNADHPISDAGIACYTAAYGEGIYKSDNGGRSWYALKTDQDDIHLYFKRLFLDPANKTLYVATTGAGLFSIDLKDETIQKIEQYKRKNVRSIAFVNDMGDSKPAILAGVFGEGISNVLDEEISFLNTGLTYRDVNTIVSSGNHLFAGTVKDVFRWDSQKKTWESASEGIKNKNIISMAATPEGDIIYAGAGGYLDEKGFFESVPCLYVSKDNGKTWKAWDDGIPGSTLVYSIAINSKRPERIYVGTSDSIYMSNDGGDDWGKTGKGLPDDFRVFDIRVKNLDDGNALVYAAGSKGLYMAIDTNSPGWIKRDYGLPKTNMTGVILK